MKIAIIGGGIVGASAAHRFVQAGHGVTLFEADPDARPPSDGNAGLLAFPEFVPLCNPATLRSAPRWLFDPLGPLALRWRDVPTLAPWLMRFARSSLPAASRRSAEALVSLILDAPEAFETLHAETGLSNPVAGHGYLAVHDTDQALAAGEAEAAEAERLAGQGFARLNAAEARALVPQLEGPFAGAIRLDGYRWVDDPAALRRRLLGALEAAGGLTRTRVTRLQPGPSGITLILGDGSAQLFDKAIVTSGIASRDLVRPLGLRVVLETERGYNTTFPDLGWSLPMPVGFSAHGFVSTPLACGLRVGGAVELAHPEAPPNFARASALRARMRRYVPALPEEGGVEWMGCRPSTPDCIPVISRHPRDDRILMAFGHGHLGLTLSAVTAERLLALAAPGPVPASAAAFDISRFQ
jgi:D-amino-acid dehydrogenase